MSLRASTSTQINASSSKPTPTPSQPPANSSNPMQSRSAASSSATMTPELEQTLSMLSTHRSVLGYMLVTRGTHPSIIRHSGVVFEGEQGKRYAVVIARIVESVQSGLEEVKGGDDIGSVNGESDTDDIRFMRIRTKRHEIMISPDERYLLAVLHDPAT